MIDYESLRNTLDHFARTDYQFEFRAERSSLYCASLDLRLAPDEFDVTQVYRFGGIAPDDEQVLYLISAFTGIKGTLVLGRDDVYAEDRSFEMAQKFLTHPYGEWICS